MRRRCFQETFTKHLKSANVLFFSVRNKCSVCCWEYVQQCHAIVTKNGFHLIEPDQAKYLDFSSTVRQLNKQLLSCINHWKPKMPPMMAASMMSRMTTQMMIIIFFCGEGGENLNKTKTKTKLT